ncbi:hypothetical protein BV25DRAFT_1772750, partial [Artomyces pyxidatus]
CSDCLLSISKVLIPRYALANGLYRGHLPVEFQDLTWVEEMVCSIYRSSTMVTRIYGSLDPNTPRVFHGNTCAHELNVYSLVNILPRTPSDMNDMLSVVFIGNQKDKMSALKKLFFIRKKKVWKFLIWLKAHNKLYKDVTLSEDSLDMYSDIDIIPGLYERVI